jgi:hypothetical protein
MGNFDVGTASIMNEQTIVLLLAKAAYEGIRAIRQ